MASNQAPPAQEFTVRIPGNVNTKRYSIMKFGGSSKIDFTKCGGAKLERENNFREFKQANDLETMPKFGAGSEYGRDQKDEARRKKYGIYLKKYNPERQPWLLKMGTGKEAKKYKGVKEGGVNENASFYVFSQSTDGAFEASPVEEWFNFTPQINYKYLNAEEAEEKFSRRNQTLNYFSIMLEKKLQQDKHDDGDGEEDEKKTKGKKSKGKNSFLLTDMDEWDALDEGDGSDSDQEEGKEAKPKKKKKGKGPKKTKARKNSDDEALEESDDLDEGNEVDYMTDSDSEDEDMYKDKDREDDNKYKEKGVEDEDGLRNVLNSDDEEEEQEKKEENEEEEDEEKEKKDKKDGESDSESSSSSDSDSDPEKDPNFSSALFMQKGKKSKKESSTENTPSNSRSVTPTAGENPDDKAKKRKADNASPVPGKKPKMETPAVATPTPVTSGSSDGISDEAVRRYLMRKPMTTKDLLQKFKSKNTGLNKEQLVTTIAQILKRLNPERNKVKDKLFLYIKPK